MTEGARADLIAIGDYIAQDNPLRALSFVDELEIRCTALGVARMPMPSFQIARLPAFDARSMVATEYSISCDPRLFTFSMS